jgi:hypothetical protein
LHASKVVDHILQSIFSVAVRRETLTRSSDGGSPRQRANNALHSEKGRRFTR